MSHFIHTPYQPGETVAAIATPPGEGGVAIVRISGDQAFEIGSKIFSGPVSSYQSHTAHFGQVLDTAGKKVDDALLLVMHGKRSYTGENTVEIHCHGGSLVTRRVLETALEAGARPAKPGEFTFKAFMNGKLDLSQAEAVQELICAKNELALEAAAQQLDGRLSAKIASFQLRLTDLAAIIEASVDFPEEGLEFATTEEVCEQLNHVRQELEQLLATFHHGRIAREGIALCLVGCPNVGKSSLMNALLDQERAIVSHVPGTTRDLLEENLRIGGLNFRLIDTAGIRSSEEVVEQEGIRRSQQALNKADLILFVLDSSQGLSHGDQQLLELLPHRQTVAIWNKSDLGHDNLPSLPFKQTVKLSAKYKQGLGQLQESIEALIWENGLPDANEVMITNVRHKESLENAIEPLKRLSEGLRQGISPEFLSIEMRHCLLELGKIIGVDIGEDILSAIFSKFCIGK